MAGHVRGIRSAGSFTDHSGRFGVRFDPAAPTGRSRSGISARSKGNSKLRHIFITTRVQYDADEGGRLVKPVRITRISTRRQRRRFWRWRAWRSKNPLRRTLSPLERLAVAGTAVLGIALVALTVTAAVLSLFAAERSIRGTHVVNATVAVTNPANPTGIQPEISTGTYVAHLQWTWRGTEDSVDMPVLTPLSPGSTVQVRVGNNGHAVDNPWSSDNPVPVLLETAMGGFIFTAAIMLGVIAVLRKWLFRRRAALWQWEWELVSSLWCGRGS